MTAEMIAFNDGELEPEDAAIRRHLGLMPTLYSSKTGHPDQEPCPSWCWTREGEGRTHDIEPSEPDLAQHSSAGTALVRASHYRGYALGGGVISAATFEVALRQDGQGSPAIGVSSRSGHPTIENQVEYHHEIMKLSVRDARDLVTALKHFIEVAEAG